MLNILCITDDKPGHRSQLEGLLMGLRQLTHIQSHWHSLNHPSRPPSGFRADLIIAAGHRTHWPALMSKLRYGGKLVVLMKPSLPLCLFDLCIAPVHDGLKEGRRVLNTQGALNAIPVSTQASATQGLLLIGGPSRHYDWDNIDLLGQIQELARHQPAVDWVLTTSRRTPADFLRLIPDLKQIGIKVVPLEQTDREWLLAQYQRSGQIWVTADSVSMVYESLSSGARVGLLHVPEAHPNRISRGLESLLKEGRLMQLQDLEAGTLRVTDNPSPLQEGRRVAAHILTHLLKHTEAAT